jgi:hypothetical protein
LKCLGEKSFGQLPLADWSDVDFGGAPLDLIHELNHLDLSVLECAASAVEKSDITGRIAATAWHSPKHWDAINHHGKPTVWAPFGIMLLGGGSAIEMNG